MNPPPAKMPRVEENTAASPSTQSPAKPGGIDMAGSPPKVWKPSIRDTPAKFDPTQRAQRCQSSANGSESSEGRASGQGRT
eukprot:8423006-Pyramimonas_sp.AAC.1